jgi:hypothetical protein
MQWSACVAGGLSAPGDTVQKTNMKTSNDSVKERIAKYICTRNKRHLFAFLNTKAAVNPMAFYGLKLMELTDPLSLVLRHASLFVLLLILSSFLPTKRPDVLK